MTYPGQIDTDVDLEVVINDFRTELIGSIDDAMVTITISSKLNRFGTSLPASGLVEIDDEIIAYSSIDSSGPNPVLMGCTRGFDGTQAAAHTGSTAVEMRWVARHHNLLNAAIRTIQAVLGVNPQGSHTDVATRLDKITPFTVPFASPTTDWSFTHTRDTLVVVQLYELIDSLTGTYRLFTAEIQQVLDIGGASQVNITLPEAKAGYAVVSGGA
jgi:hypothetical protein